MVSRLLTRRPAVPDLQTWTPEGTIVVQRYGALKDAVVLVYTAEGDRLSCYATACLGCTYREAVTGSGRFTLDDAGHAANVHASHCRALPRGVPERPDDSTAEALILAQVETQRETIKPRPVNLTDFHGVRVDLQRTTDWVIHALLRLARSQPHLLTTTPASSGTGTLFHVQPYPVD